MKVLVVGWFSYEGYGATAGDLLARDVVLRWLDEAERSYDVVVAEPFLPGKTWHDIEPSDYRDLVFVCGPFGNGPPITELLERFRHCRLHGVNLSMLQPLREWNPFDTCLERDSDERQRPDVTFVAAERRLPVVGVILVHPQSEYGHRALHGRADEAVETLLRERDLARVPIDTRLDARDGRRRSPGQVTSLIGRMDAVITTRLHGLVLALGSGVPALPIDPIRGGAKVLAQAEAIGWPVSFRADALDAVALDAALDYCLSEEARSQAARCAAWARASLADVHRSFVRSLADTDKR